jgi:hypothetical protein
MKKIVIAALAVSSVAAFGGATGTASASCSRPLGTDQCIENVVCGTPHNLAVKAGVDEYVDPRVDCVA